MILNEEPVANVLTLAIPRQRLVLPYIVDEERHQLLGELIRTVVVRTVGHQRWHAVGIVVGAHEMVA